MNHVYLNIRINYLSHTIGENSYTYVYTFTRVNDIN